MKLLLIAFLSMFSFVALGQEALPPEDMKWLAQALGFLVPLLKGLSPKVVSVLVTVFTAIGVARFFVKPVMATIDAYVRLDKNPNNDDLVARLEKKKWFKVLRFLLDWFGSVKL